MQAIENQDMAGANLGWLNGMIGVLIFSASLPATRMAVGGFDPLFLTAARATIAALLAGFMLVAFRVRLPERGDLFSLVVIALGVVVGFPLLTAIALSYAPSSAHSIVFIGLLPLMTAIFGIIRGSERPKPIFWVFAFAGSLLVCGFALLQGAAGTLEANLYMVAAIVVCGLGYAEGAILTRKLGGWQVISWALLISMPVMLVLTWIQQPATYDTISSSAWAGLAYVSLFSMFIGFVFWYKGLAQGGIARVGQLQLLQPFFGLLIAALVLGEQVSHLMILTSVGVLVCVLGARKFG